MSDPIAKKLPLRHPAEIPIFVLMVVLNVAIAAVLIDFLVSKALLPTALRGTNWEPTWRNGAALEPKGELGLILLAAGRYAAENVEASELVDQGRHLGGFWVGISQLPRSHPWTVRRIWRPHQLGLFGPANTVGQPAPR